MMTYLLFSTGKGKKYLYEVKLIRLGNISFWRIPHSFRSRKKRLMETVMKRSHSTLVWWLFSSSWRYAPTLWQPRWCMCRCIRFMTPFLTLRYPFHESPKYRSSWRNCWSSIRSMQNKVSRFTQSSGVWLAISPFFSKISVFGGDLSLLNGWWVE